MGEMTENRRDAPWEHLPLLDRGLARLRYAARLKYGWSGSMPREEARALLNEIDRLQRTAAQREP